jgi:predicted nuclease of predicted toxin-antitoxin system
MLKLAADENLNNDILRGLGRMVPAVDIVRVQDVGLAGADDAQVLDWAASAGRVLVTHDVATMTAAAYERAARGQSMPGIFEVPASISTRQAIDDLRLIVEVSVEGEWEGQVRYLPLR